MTDKGNAPQGIGGWLAILIAGMLVLGPLLALARTYSEFAAAERQYPAIAQTAEWSSFKIAEWLALFIFCMISIYGGFGLATRRTPDIVSMARLVLWISNPLSIIVTEMIIPVVMVSESGKQVAMAIPALVSSLIFAAIWTLYLNHSKRVKNTYGKIDELPVAHDSAKVNQASHILSSPSTDTIDGGSYFTEIPSNDVATQATQIISYPVPVDEDLVYRKIAHELENGSIDKAIWIRLFAECGGDEKLTKVSYIKLRAERLIAAEHLRFEKEMREYASDLEKREKLRRSMYEIQQMEEHGITFDGERYIYGEYKYDRVSDAISYAKLQKIRSM